METIQYPAPRPAPPLAVRRLGPEDAAQIAALYRAAGRDGAWCGEDTVRALFKMGAAWWGGFAGDALALCAACTAFAANTPQAAAIRGALAQETGRLPCAPQFLLLPPAVSRRGEALAGALFGLLAERLPLPGTDADRPREKRALFRHSQEKPMPSAGADRPRETGTADDADQAPQTKTAQGLWAALPVKASAPVLAAYFAAGFAAVRMRPLASLRPHYLLVRRGAPEQKAENRAPSGEAATGAPGQKAENAPQRPGTKGAGLPPKPEPDALRRVYLPLADTLAVSRLLEQGFCATALCRSSADERVLLRLERGAADVLFGRG